MIRICLNHKSPFGGTFGHQTTGCSLPLMAVPGMLWAYGQQPPQRYFKVLFSAGGFQLTELVGFDWCLVLGRYVSTYSLIVHKVMYSGTTNALQLPNLDMAQKAVPCARFVSCAMLQQLGYFIGCLEDISVLNGIRRWGIGRNVYLETYFSRILIAIQDSRILGLFWSNFLPDTASFKTWRMLPASRRPCWKSTCKWCVVPWYLGPEMELFLQQLWLLGVFNHE